MDEKIFEKFSESARSILVSSQQIAESMTMSIGSEHILLSLVLNRGTFANEILREYDINLDQIKLILSLHNITSASTDENLTGDVQNILMSAIKLASDHGHITVDAEHLLLAIVSTSDCTAYEVIERIGVNPEHLKKQIQGLFDEIAEIDRLVKHEEKEDKKTTTKTKPKSKTPALDYFTTDLTQKALQKQLDPLVGRNQEIERVIQILSRRAKNNPILVGEPGVGKTAIVEGLAQMIVNGRVPTHLLGKRLITLDLTLLIAGTMYRGQFEDRIKKIIDEIKLSNDIILFIDEIHTIIGAGSAEGSLDAANILKPALTKGWIRLIGATTHEEYRKQIKKDPAFERRLQPVTVEEPNIEDAIAIIQGLRPHYEKHHGVAITDTAIESAVRFSQRYITEQFLPDKAIDLIDEAAAATRLKNEPDTIATRLKKKLARLNREKDQAVLDEEYQLASQLKEQTDRISADLEKLAISEAQVSQPSITDHDIALLIGKRTGIPVTNLIAAEKIRYAQLAELLKEQVIGQDEAIEKIANAIKRARTGLADPARPIGSFMFLGPTGVGKTELARVLAREVFGSEKALVKIDMSDFMERHNTSRLVGAPAGYVGYDDGGKLTETVRKQPYSVILFDEIEKAHPDVFNMMLQVLEDGQLIDAKNQAINFRNTIIIMTSNLGMAELTRQAAIGFSATNQNEEERARRAYERVKQSVSKIIKDHFRPEFLNRLDHTIVFQPLDKAALHKIIHRELSKLTKRVADLGYQLEITERAIHHLAQLGYDPDNGARPLRRAIAEHIEVPLADYLLTNEHKKGTTLELDYRASSLAVKTRRKQRKAEIATTA